MAQTFLGTIFPGLDKNKPGYSKYTHGIASDDILPGVIQVAEVSLSAAQMLAARATPIELVAAPGAGYALQFVKAVFIYDYTAVFTETADNAVIRYTNGAGTIASLTLETTGLLDATSDKISTLSPLATDIIVTPNAALVFHNTGDGEWGGTGSPCRIKVAYRIITTGL
jgi:hypothetical protein